MTAHLDLESSTRCSTNSAAVPAYFPPGPEWDRMIEARPHVGMVVLNLADGPGDQLAPNVAAQVAWLRRAGIMILGYIDTANATRPEGAVMADARRYEEWYQTRAVFLDQAHVPEGLVDSLLPPPSSTAQTRLGEPARGPECGTIDGRVGDGGGRHRGGLRRRLPGVRRLVSAGMDGAVRTEPLLAHRARRGGISPSGPGPRAEPRQAHRLAVCHRPGGGSRIWRWVPLRSPPRARSLAPVSARPRDVRASPTKGVEPGWATAAARSPFQGLPG